MIRAHRTPQAVQRFLNGLKYNTEPPPDPATLRSFRGVIKHRTAHCLEATITAAVILERHGFPPMVMSLESIDGLDHVIFVYRARGRWGSVARSRDPGLHGRRPVFRSLRHLALTYSIRSWTRRGVSRPTARLTCGCSAPTTGGCHPATSGRWSGCCSRFPTAPSVTEGACGSAARGLLRVQGRASRRAADVYDRSTWTEITTR